MPGACVDAAPGAALREARALADAGRWQEVRRVLAPERAGLAGSPEALHLLAEAYAAVDDRDSALPAVEEALAGFRACGDRRGELGAENLRGTILLELGRLDEAMAGLLRAMAAADELGEQKTRAHVANNLGIVCDLREDRERSVEHFRGALEAYGVLGDVRGQARIHHNLGIASREMERWDEAEAHFERAAECAERAGDPCLLGFALVERAELLLRRGDTPRAETLARQALLRFDVHASLYGLAEAHRLLGRIAWERGDPGAAAKRLGRALELAELAAAPLIAAEVRLERGRLRVAVGEREAGLDDLHAAHDTFERLDAARRAARARELIEEASAPA